MKDASFWLIGNMCHLTNYRPYQLLAFLNIGLDLVGPFKKAKGGFTHIFIAVDKFTKWIKVKPAASITVAKEVEFIKEIMYRFGVPNNIITDNGTQFTVREFKNFCADLSIKINYASMFDSQSNSQVEHSNSMILQGLKPRIFDKLKPYVGEWVKELLLVATSMTHFFLIFDRWMTTPTPPSGPTDGSVVMGCTVQAFQPCSGTCFTVSATWGLPRTVVTRIVSSGVDVVRSMWMSRLTLPTRS
jgi:hypothetical protein